MSNDPAPPEGALPPLPPLPAPPPAAGAGTGAGATAGPERRCGNCGAPLKGPFCFACGQPEKGMIRHLASVMSDVLDTIFNVDSRIFRSIVPLYFRPGHLTCEYFAGRRTRYVTPFRLFFFLCVIAFFAIQSRIDLHDVNFELAGNSIAMDSAQTVAEVEQRRDSALKGLETAIATTAASAGSRRQLERSAEAIRKQADSRLAYLHKRDAAIAAGRDPPPDPADDFGLSIDGQRWDPVKHPLDVGWLPGFVNQWLNDTAVRATANLKTARRDPAHFVAGLFSVLPQTLFVLMPLFAVLLKIVYLFKRRLYMEHLMVALHSHAFIFLSLLLVVLVSWLRGWVEARTASAATAFNLVTAAIWVWLPVYLFLMQKRVYGQGWLMTTLKYGVVGICYLVMISFGLVGAVLASLTLA